MISQDQDHEIFLDRLFKDYFAGIDKRNVRGTSPAGDFFREVLLTYRLIFGQDRRSWKLCSKTGTHNEPRSKTYLADPLLNQLYCRDWEEVSLYDEINAPDARSLYSSRQDFPFFGERLIALQEYIRPHNLKTLYADRRSISRFRTIWAAIFFGIVTFILALLGLGLAGAQVAAAFKTTGPSQPNQSTI